MRREVQDARGLGVFVVPHWFVDQGWMKEVGPHATLIYLYLLRLANEEDEPPTVAQMQDKTGVSERQIYRSLRALVQAKLLQIESRGNQHSGPSVYRLLDPHGKKVITSGRKKRADPKDGFEEAWALYPKRPGNSKAAALRAWIARVREGVKPPEMIEGTKRYAAYVQATSTESKYVKMGSTFYGPDHHFASDYELPDEGPATPKGAVEELMDFYGKEQIV